MASVLTDLRHNEWRLETPGNDSWARSARPGSPNKHLMVSCDAHINEPAAFTDNLAPHVKAMLPRVEVDADGVKWDVVPGMRRIRALYQGEGDAEDNMRVQSARSPDQIIDNMDRDGVDIQVTYPNKGMFMFGLGDSDAMYAMASAYNDWLADYFSAKKDRVLPMAIILTRDIDRAIAELERIAKLDFFRGLMLPAKPIYGPHSAEHLAYNNLELDPLWARIQELNIPITVHVGTGSDSRAFRGPGAAITCRAAVAHPSTLEFVSHMCTGVIERFPQLRFATIEAGISYLPYLLEVMDETHRKHHMWIRHKLKRLPSEYFYENGFASFEEDHAGLLAIDPRLDDSPYRRLENNYLWANDAPHHEGSWPHSALAIERQMKNLTDEQRAKILGGNAVRCFNIEDLVAKFLAKFAIRTS